MSKQTQGLAAVMPSTEELKTAGIRELSAEELLEVNGGRQVEGAINPYGPDPDIPDDPPSSSGSSSDYSSGSSGGSSGSSDTSNDSSSDSSNSGTSSDSSSNTSEDTSSSSSGSDTSDDNSSDSTSSSGSSSNASEDTSSSGSGSDTSNDSSSDSNNSSGSSSNASEDTSSSSSSDTSNDSSSDSYEDEECGNYDNSSSDTGSNASENTSSNNSYSPDYEDEEPGSYDNSCNNPDAGSSDSSSSSSSYPDKDNNDSYAKNHSESSSGGESSYTSPSKKNGKHTVDAGFNPETEHKGESYTESKRGFGERISSWFNRKKEETSNSPKQRFRRASKDSTVETQNGPTGQEKQSLKGTFLHIGNEGKTQTNKKDKSGHGIMDRSNKHTPGITSGSIKRPFSGSSYTPAEQNQEIPAQGMSFPNSDKSPVVPPVQKESEIIEEKQGIDRKNSKKFFNNENGTIKKPDMKFPIDMSKVTSIDEYGPREEMKIGDKTTKPVHGGMDIAAPEGTPILAATDGWVREISFNESSYGNYIVIGNDKGWTGTLTYYGHLKEAPSLAVGEPVKKGQQIGLVGSTGLSTGPHLHFEVRTNYGSTKHNPRDFFAVPF
ncbi:MAG: M23 family metallopeptidase [Treponema sp.]|uniref:M23 family metallopeptidase n=1 Tax=Treponema sp. TaxID=166 RepID=UPI003FA205F3